MNEGEDVMRRVCISFAVAVSIVLACCFLAGCFGGEEEPSTVAPQTTVSTPDDTGSTITTVPSATTTTEGPELIDGLPRAFVEALGERPIVVMFYVPGGVDDESVLKSVRDSQADYANYVFLIYDYRVPSAYGDLSAVLGIGYPPQIVLIDRHGVTQTVWSGFVDKGTLNQTLLNLGRY